MTEPWGIVTGPDPVAAADLAAEVCWSEHDRMGLARPDLASQVAEGAEAVEVLGVLADRLGPGVGDQLRAAIHDGAVLAVAWPLDAQEPPDPTGPGGS